MKTKWFVWSIKFPEMFWRCEADNKEEAKAKFFRRAPFNFAPLVSDIRAKKATG